METKDKDKPLSFFYNGNGMMHKPVPVFQERLSGYEYFVYISITTPIVSALKNYYTGI
jgi:hypothetical protein